MSQTVTIRQAIDAEITRRKAHDDYYEYVVTANQGFARTRMHEYLCGEIGNFVTKDTGNAYDILLVTTAPQHGKSISITETLPSWYLGHNPTKSVIVAGYSGDFVTRFGRRNLDKIREHGSSIFGLELAETPCNTQEFELSNHRGRALFAGVRGGITGNPANLVIIDDPIKTKEEAYSPTTREAIIGEWLFSIKSRLAAGAKIIVIMTRWHEDDLFGYILRTEANVRKIIIPLECEEAKGDPLGRAVGDALLPEIGKDNEWLKQFKASYMTEEGSAAWNALFQCRPSAKEGNILLRRWWQFYTTLPKIIPYKIISVDATFKDGDKNDFVAIQAWGKVGRRYYLLDAVKKRLNFVDTLDAIRTMREKIPDLWYVLVEDKANGSAIVNVLQQEMEGVVAVQPEGGKVTRANAVSPAIERGSVFLPRYASFSEDLIREAAQFPNGAHDDQVDCMSQALHRMIFVDAELDIPPSVHYVEYTRDMLHDLETASEETREFLLNSWGYPLEWSDET